MARASLNFTNDLESAVSFFRPVLQRLRTRQESMIGIPVFLSLFPHLWNIDTNGGKWGITVLKANLINCRAKFAAQYHPSENMMVGYIILDATCFVEAKVPNEIRKAIAVHEFCHFLALLYSSISITEEHLSHKLRKKLSKIIDELTTEEVINFYRFLNEMRPFSNDFSTFEQTRDDHFRLNYEKLDLSYSDLFKNLLLSHQMFDEYFDKELKAEFQELVHRGKVKDAYNLYISIVEQIAEEKWLTKDFAINQAIGILTKFYFDELI